MRKRHKLYWGVTLVTLFIISCNIRGNESNCFDGKTPNQEETVAEQDSSVSELANVVDSLTTIYNNSKNEMSDLKTSVKNLEKQSKFLFYFVLTSIILSLISIVCQIIRSKNRSLNDEIGNLNSDITEIKSRLKRLDYNNRQQGIVSNKQNPSFIVNALSGDDSIEERLMHIEKKIQILSKKNEATSFSINLNKTSRDTRDSDVDSHYNVLGHKIGYANLNTEKYFIELFNSKQETCVYKIDYNDIGKGTFDLISLDKIKSSNGWEDVIDIAPSSDCRMEEADSYKTLRLGECQKIEDGAWEVTTHLIIQINR